MQLQSKLPQVGLTIFSQMSQLADAHGALNLSQGFPDFDAPEALKEALQRHVQAGHNQYGAMTGVAALREHVASKIARLYRNPVCADKEVTITPGATQALFCAIQTLVRAGDEVIVFDPCYDSYAPAVTLAGGRCVHIALNSVDFSVDWQKFADALTERTRLVIINSPHNPSGAVLQRSDLQQLADLIRERDVYLLSDEVYEHLVFDDQSHCSVLTHEELYQRACVVSSFGKTYHVTGWKTGYMVAPAKLTAELRKVHQYVSFCAVTPIQHALADFMQAQPEHVDQLPAFYQRKRDQLCLAIENSRFTFVPTASTYFQLLDYRAIRDDLNDVQMAHWLTTEHGVASIPLSVFYQQAPVDQHLLRVCFAKQEDTLSLAGEKLCAI
ncbi:pyridoxal phosphate-dependent aminotransferase [Pseudomonas sp. C27(2019)]|uniref:pyridoxal phosphate-dependent aminotransferase n=1 Tax=Pseudomonas sp. C27(2019) TaxID=2604941 RepID=UPI001245AF44|nr:pyridoxal phosphate-dependent aminotransferase [Pseudomonas sp. C27(2019)]QEY58368.1 pyridoxal phosphate-dependent aminotransferase [Pseudomonas sp. C27(2019)]